MKNVLNLGKLFFILSTSHLILKLIDIKNYYSFYDVSFHNYAKIKQHAYFKSIQHF